MEYVSTRGAAPVLGFDDVLIEGLAVDGGLYVPSSWPQLGRLPDGAYWEVAATVIGPFIEGSVVAPHLADLAESTYRRFRHPEVAPLREVGPDHHLLELFWGPTLSFKDYALQLVGAMFDLVLAERGTRITVLGATSGDTGSAAIEALADRDNVDVLILYPLGRVSEVQRRQMTTVEASNVRAVAVEGSFDDCQDLVKAAFSDPELRATFGLAAVNSINWARVMVQAVYHVWAASRLGAPFTVSVPTGNFGNVLAADVARRMGAPITRLAVGNNANHGLADLIRTGRLQRSEVVPTLAPAMDIQVPSNLERLLFELLDRNGDRVSELLAHYRSSGSLVLDEVTHSRMARLLSASWLDDAGIEETIRRVHAQTGLVIDPHTATGWEAETDGPLVSVATAHPAKFAAAVEAAIGVAPGLPEDLADLLVRTERTEVIPPDLAAVVELLHH